MGDEEKVVRMHPHIASRDDVLDVVRGAKACFVVSLDVNGTFKYRQFEENALNKGEFFALLGYLHAVLPRTYMGVE